MGFTGTLVVWRGSGEPPSEIAGGAELEPFQERQAWNVSYLGAELVGDDARPLLAAMCHWTGAPALAAFVFDSDCAFVSAADQAEHFWNACLVRGIVAALDEIDEAEMVRRYGSAELSAEHGARWARAAGLEPDDAALRDVFAFGDADEIFLGLKLFDRLLSALGLPPSADPAFYEDA